MQVSLPKICMLKTKPPLMVFSSGIPAPIKEASESCLASSTI